MATPTDRSSDLTYVCTWLSHYVYEVLSKHFSFYLAPKKRKKPVRSIRHFTVSLKKREDELNKYENSKNIH